MVRGMASAKRFSIAGRADGAFQLTRRTHQTRWDGSYVDYGYENDAQLQSSNALGPVGKKSEPTHIGCYSSDKNPAQTAPPRSARGSRWNASPTFKAALKRPHSKRWRAISEAAIQEAKRLRRFTP